MLTYVNTIVRVSESLFVHTGDQNRPGVAMIEKKKQKTLILLLSLLLLVLFIIFGIYLVLNK